MSPEAAAAKQADLKVTSVESAVPAASDSLRAVWTLQPGSVPTALSVIGPDTRNMPRPPMNEDYGYCSRFGDLDSLLDVLVHLARLFPATTASKYPSSAASIEQKRLPLVVIGGPVAEEDGRGGNAATALINGSTSPTIAYDLEDKPRLLVGDRVIPTAYDAAGTSITRDGGVIIRCQSPWNGSVRVLVFQGTHTFGVLGAVRALTDPSVANRNAELLIERLGPDPFFVCPVQVGVDKGAVLSPTVAARDIIKLKA